MKLEAGKTYMTRDGREVTIAAVNGEARTVKVRIEFDEGDGL